MDIKTPRSGLWGIIHVLWGYGTGPIVGKELRIMARQQRYYLLRLAYLLTLVVLMYFVWLQVMPHMRLDGTMTARMARAGKGIVSFVAWFQFIGLQLVAVITLSNAISHEISHRTLPALMTTPMTSLHIVLGKLSSKGLHMLQLFLISFPLLALARVFGGVPWDYLIASSYITLTTVWFLSVLTLLYSVFFKRAYTVMIFTITTAAILFGLVPLILVYFLETTQFLRRMQGVRVACGSSIVHTCPYLSFWIETQHMLSPRARALPFSWELHCAFMVLLSLPLLVLACLLVRRAALRHMIATKTRKEYKPPPVSKRHAILYRPLFLHNWIRRTLGTGMVWKEFLLPVLGRFRFVVYIATIVLGTLFFLGLLIAILLEQLGLIGFLFFVSVVSFFILAVLFTVIVPATCITAEKESQSWPILMTTTMSNTRILGGKLAGVLRRIVLAWSPFLIVFWMLAYTLGMAPGIAVQLSGITILSIGFLVSLGIYLSTRFQRTAPAVLTNLSIVGFLWGLLPFFALFLQEKSYDWRYLVRTKPCRTFIQGTLNLTPSGFILTLLNQDLERSLWHYSNRSYTNPTFIFISIYIAASLFFLWRARANIRRHQIY